jgi:rubrerythrin
MSIFAAGDVLQFAIGMEENGALFYRQAAEISENSDVKKLFLHMASEEDEHQKTFERFLSKMDLNEPIEEYPGQYLDYLNSFVDDKAKSVFCIKDARELKSIDVSSALDFALKMDMASIRCFTKLRESVGEYDQKVIDSIIEEESKHVAKLSETKKSF